MVFNRGTFAYFRYFRSIAIVTDVCITKEDQNKLAIIPLNKYFPKRSYGLMRKGKFCPSQAKRFIDIMVWNHNFLRKVNSKK